MGNLLVARKVAQGREIGNLLVAQYLLAAAAAFARSDGGGSGRPQTKGRARVKQMMLAAAAAALIATPALAEPAGGAPGAITRFGFVALNVSDMDRSLAFYRGLGLVERFRHETPQVLEVGLGATSPPPGSELLLVRRKPGPGAVGPAGGYSRTAFMVTNLDEICRRLKAEGRQVRGPTVAAAARVRVAFVPDPDGYSVELIEAMP
jgi:catechol 2,3-dioxygenase-like lactoylglutathione lyase family enzyme